MVGYMQVAQHVLLRHLLVSSPDRQWFSRFFRKQAHVDWLERTCLIYIYIVCKGDNRQLFLNHDSLIRMNNLNLLSGLDDPPALPPPLHDLLNNRLLQLPMANANDDQYDDDSDRAPNLCDESDDEDDIDEYEENDSDVKE